MISLARHRSSSARFTVERESRNSAAMVLMPSQHWPLRPERFLSTCRPPWPGGLVQTGRYPENNSCVFSYSFSVLAQFLEFPSDVQLCLLLLVCLSLLALSSVVRTSGRRGRGERPFCTPQWMLLQDGLLQFLPGGIGHWAGGPLWQHIGLTEGDALL